MSQRILIAEDDEPQGAVLRAALERRGHQVDVVTNGLDAVRRLRTGRYDLGLLDYDMPEVNGLAAARILHEFLTEAECPRLVAVTAAPETVEQALVSGVRAFDAVVSKRLGLRALLTIIDTHLASAARKKARALEHRQAAVERAGDRKPRLAAASLVVPSPAFEAQDGCVASKPDLPPSYNPFELPPNSDGQVRTISLAAFQATLGPDWSRVALRAMIKAEHIIKRHLFGGDVLTRGGDNGFIVWFNSTDTKQNESVLAAAAREIRVRFLTDFGEDTTPDIRATPAAVRQYPPAREGGQP